MDPVKLRLRFFMAAVLGIMVLGTAGFMTLEGLSLGDAFYFSIVTIATVGYGDIHPATTLGKIFAVILIITGVGAFLGVVANSTELLLSKREKEVRLQKLNMVIGVFFSEIGTRLLSNFSRFDPQLDVIRQELLIRDDWTDEDFQRVKKRLGEHRYRVDPHAVELEDLREFLEKKGNFLLRLWENPNLLEHEAFTDLLRAVFHLKEELLSREDLSLLPDSDRTHIAGDINRAYGLMARQWLDYMRHLKMHYPYLFSLAMRTNPFDPKASPIVS